MIKYLQFKRKNESRRENHQHLHPEPKITRLAWSPAFWKFKTYEKSLSIWTQTQDSWGPASDFTRRKNHKKSASESFTLRNILSVESKTQGSLGPCVQWLVVKSAFLSLHLPSHFHIYSYNSVHLLIVYYLLCAGLE